MCKLILAKSGKLFAGEKWAAWPERVCSAAQLQSGAGDYIISVQEVRARM